MRTLRLLDASRSSQSRSRRRPGTLDALLIASQPPGPAVTHLEALRASGQVSRELMEKVQGMQEELEELDARGKQGEI